MKKVIILKQVIKYCGELFNTGLHKKRQESLGRAVYGCLHSERLNISSMGRSLARNTGRYAKHCIKQVDRLLGNSGYNFEHLSAPYVLTVIGPRRQIIVSLDWTEYGATEQSRISLNHITNHGRATALLCKTVKDGELKHRRNFYERQLLSGLRRIIGKDVKVLILADRGFADTRFFRYIRKLGWDYIIRIRCNTYVNCVRASRLVPWNGRIIEFRDALLTAKCHRVSSVVMVKKKGMTEPWILASSIAGRKEDAVRYYGRRFTCEEQFRDEKDDRFGLGSKETLVSTPERRDRLIFINALAVMFLTLLGAAGEALGCDRLLRANTVKRRTHSLFRQGREYLQGVNSDFLKPLKETLKILLSQQKYCSEEFAIL